MNVSCFSYTQLLAMLWTVAHQAALAMCFSSVIPISGMLETAAALYSGCHLWHKVQPRLGKKKEGKKKEKMQ